MDPKNVVGVGWYLPEQWDKLREISADRDDLEKTFDEWESYTQKAVAKLARTGVTVTKVLVDVEELRKWCLERGMVIDAVARSQFIVFQLSSGNFHAQK
ncbi:MAG TPA: hypothetical protein PKW95_23910 [bacterium]|nr:hypothetical protein [bacterium]